ncbi:mechanosensitive ion channel protein 9-like [Chenopodium quinoa]|uniref:mechanosensitive ion channel protein 9-like n=1 Tax=Chenopodium quinoa TaxID=63459 RepID=UPI000B77A885|nr:mechanosensitive ion channel protein 9-like [Chenopodium quinoa]
MSTPQGNETSVRITDNANSSIIDDNSSITYIKFDRGIRKKVLFWCNLVVFLVAAAICVASFTVPSLRKAPPSGIAMWQWSLLVTVLLCGPLLSKLLHYMVIFIDTKFELFGVAAAARENVVYYTVELIESAWVVLWFSIILVAWLWVVEDPSYLGMKEDQNEKLKKKFAKTFPIITVTLITIIIGSVFWLLKDVVLLMAKSSFHISKFFERVNDALMHQHVINRLTPRADTYDIGEPNLCQRMCDWKEKMPSLSDQVNQKNVSCWGMQKVINWFFDNENLTYKLVDGEDKKIESEDGAIEAAKYIYSLLAQSEDSM